MSHDPDPATRLPNCGVCDATDLSAEPGAYALLIRLEKSVALPKRCAQDRLDPGRYVYFGSAKGGGGIRARCRRHLAPKKAVHWHVDRLTVGARPGMIRAIAFAGASECALGRRLIAAGALAAPVRGFGNSDCHDCEAHLFVIHDDVPWERIAEVLQERDQSWTRSP